MLLLTRITASSVPSTLSNVPLVEITPSSYVHRLVSRLEIDKDCLKLKTETLDHIVMYTNVK